MADLSDDRERYEAIEEFLTPDERARIERLRVERESGARWNGYGHDLIAAIARGHRRRARELVEATFDRQLRASRYGRDVELTPKTVRAAFAATLRTAIEICGAHGVEEDEVRLTLQRVLDATDATSIPKLLTRHERRP